MRPLKRVAKVIDYSLLSKREIPVDYTGIPVYMNKKKLSDVRIFD